jgi:transcriptional regulator of NAD metabolism
MANALEDYNAAPRITNTFEEAVRDGTSALAELQRVRQVVVDNLALIQASSVYSPEVQAAAVVMAAALRTEILDFADTL